MRDHSLDCPLCGAAFGEQSGSDHPQQAVYEAAPELLNAVEMALQRAYNGFEPDNQSAYYIQLKALVVKVGGKVWP